jgi:hypothetical protein
MANLIQRLFNPTLMLDALNETVELRTSRDLTIENTALQYQNDYMQESMTELMRFVEDTNWDRIGGWEEEHGFSIESIKKQADHLQALMTINPTIKKAVNVRIGYIWSRGVTFDGAGTTKMVNNKRNKQLLFNDNAHWRLEAKLATDGNIWAAKDKGSEEVVIVPIGQIAGWVLDENDPSRVNYWLRKYTVRTKNFSSGKEVDKYIEVFYPAHDYTGNTVASIDGIKVDRNIQMVHIAANRQESWILGVPDIMAAMFWAQAHKELFESGTTYVKAQGRFASKVVGKTANGAQNSAARIADTPRRDPATGEILDSGGTAVMSGGLDYQLMGKMSGGVDFGAFDPVAGLIAVGLGVPLDVLLGRSDSDIKSLEQSVVDEMSMRQQLWSEFFQSLFGRSVTVIWPKIRTEPEYRRLQSIEIANATNALSRLELRQLTLEGFGITGDPTALPDISEQPQVAIAKAIGDNAAKHAEKAAAAAATVAADAASVIGEQGVTGSVGKLSNGADNKASRDNPADTNTANK